MHVTFGPSAAQQPQPGAQWYLLAPLPMAPKAKPKSRSGAQKAGPRKSGRHKPGRNRKGETKRWDLAHGPPLTPDTLGYLGSAVLGHVGLYWLGRFGVMSVEPS